MRFTPDNSPNLSQWECDALNEAADFISDNQRDVELEMIQIVEENFWGLLA